MNPLAFVYSIGTLATTLNSRREKLLRVARAWCRDPHLADDLVQETFSKALKRLGQLRDPAAIDAWLFQILANCWRDHLRRRRTLEDIDTVDQHDDGLIWNFDPGESEIVAKVRAAIARLPSGQREALALVELMGFSYAEVAMMLEIPMGTVTSRICRAREALRVLLAELEDDENNVVQLREAKS